MTKGNILYEEKYGITKTNFINEFLDKIKSKYDFEDFENKYKYDKYENLDLPELNLDNQEKINDLNIFGIEYDQHNLNEKT